MKKILLFAIGILTSVSIQAVTDVHVDKGMTYQYDTTNNEATLIKGPSTTFTEVEIPATITLDDGITTYNVKTIGKNAFKDNKSIIEVVIANGIETINESAFQNCDQLKKITLPKTLGTIKSSAFSGCSRLTKITLPESVTSIGMDAFTGIVLYLSDITHFEFKYVKIAFDIVLIIIGAVLGGALGVPTVITMVVGGPLINFFTKRVQGIYFKIKLRSMKASKKNKEESPKQN